jgi:4-diphosphocytidyl-2-C-methyl-D-erythritol kinase
LILTEFAPAKVNLFLHVGPPRADGFHPLASLVAFAADAGDWLSAAPASGLELEITGPFGPALARERNNLVRQAALALAAAADVQPRAALRLEKHLPLASGIGGGSADAAAALRLLNRFWELGATEQDLGKLAATLGSDVPACVASASALMHGRGEILDAFAAPDLDAVLVNPGVSCATGEVYAAFDRIGAFPETLAVGPAPPSAFLGWLRLQRNDLEAAACMVSPEIASALHELHACGPALARMSGSGATVFALFDNAEEADACAALVGRRRPGWWVRRARLGRVDLSANAA